MTQLSPHFQLEEFGKPDPVPPDCVNIFTRLANEILEPIRTFVDRPIFITSGYRTPAHNQAIHGSPTSEHVATEYSCAADFTFALNSRLFSVRKVFDWIRNDPTLPFHQVILEHSAGGESIIHVSINEEKEGIRQALEGATYNASPYTAWDTVAYEPIASQEGQENV
jgi:hypothetical protein